ncbi:hypothetical protein [Citricoccus sp. GCM10030269]|uniref:hypothetical protein n=1 Tax=Citricoccus sp. GCM10030269 TaxID=3273388 RepID=UPI0036133BF9
MSGGAGGFDVFEEVDAVDGFGFDVSVDVSDAVRGRRGHGRQSIPQPDEVQGGGWWGRLGGFLVGVLRGVLRGFLVGFHVWFEHVYYSREDPGHRKVSGGVWGELPHPRSLWSTDRLQIHLDTGQRDLHRTRSTYSRILARSGYLSRRRNQRHAGARGVKGPL